MKRQIRRGVFETNSSSTHSMTMCLKEDYERFINDEDVYYSKWSDKDDGSPFWTRAEIIDYLMATCSERYKADFEATEEGFTQFLEEEGFISALDEECYFENFYDEFTTPNGETIVAFGFYGDDG